MIRPACLPVGYRSRLSRRCMLEASSSMRSLLLIPRPASLPLRCLTSTAHVKTLLPVPVDEQASTHQQLLPAPEVTIDEKATKLSRAQQILNHEFQNEDLIWEALQAPGSDVPTLNGRALTQGNKRLASLGDAVATMIIKHECYAMNRSISTF